LFDVRDKARSRQIRTNNEAQLSDLRSLLPSDRPVAFYHGRRTPGGVERLVVVEVGDAYLLDLEPKWLQARAMKKEPAGRHLTGVTVYLPRGHRFEVFAGREDDRDASHFTLGYRIDGVAGTVDGWLKEVKGDAEPSVELRIRDGPALDLTRPPF
jgi:hypothetical protein